VKIFVNNADKDNYIVISTALRGRYNKNNKIEQNLEIRKDDVCNCLTNVQKDTLIIERKITSN
jgi:hypothetical protein